MLEKPVIRGTRIPIELILRKVSGGTSEGDLVDAYLRLAREDIRAAIRYPAHWLAREAVAFRDQGGRSDNQPQSGYNGPMSTLDRITVSPDVCGGRPCIRGLRIRVKDVLDLLAAGATREEILADYPYLEPEDITAVLEFAARQNDHPVLRTN
jgi:uncharacterized protein (DUF433 family)